MGIFKKQTEPIFLKETSNAKRELETLARMYDIATHNKAAIEQKMNIIKHGISGEDNIEFELKNSHLPIYVIHDLYLECDELTAQIDYMVFAPWRIYVIECKNLIGNIEINSNGDFIRSYEISGVKKREGIYSPVTQNRRHMELIRQKVMKKQSFVSKMLFGNYFDSVFKSLVVLANPKTLLNDRYAKKEIKQQVIRADRLADYIREDSKKVEKSDWYSDKALADVAKSYLDAHIERPLQDFSELLVANEPPKPPQQTEKADDDSELVSKLRSFRLERSRAEKIKPYFIFNDAQMNELIRRKPKTEAELLQISGFGAVKCEKYGKEILGILKNL